MTRIGSIALCLLAAALAEPATAQRVTAAAGLVFAVDHHAPIAPSGRSAGRSFSLSAGPALPGRSLVPEVALSYHGVAAEKSSVDVLRLEVGGVAPILRRRTGVVPFVGGGLAGHRTWYDRCEYSAEHDPTGDPCSGARFGVGWQATGGLYFPAAKGPSASLNVRYLWNRRGFDGVTVTLGLTL